MKSTTTALILVLFGFVGIAGLQHFYLKRYGAGVLWIITFGLFGIGTLIDLFTIGTQVSNYNVKIELETIRANSLNRK